METFYLQKPEVAVLDGLEDGLLAEVVEAGEAVTEEGVHTLDLPAEPHLGVERGHGQPVTPADARLLLAAMFEVQISRLLDGLQMPWHHFTLAISHRGSSKSIMGHERTPSKPIDTLNLIQDKNSKHVKNVM